MPSKLVRVLALAIVAALLAVPAAAAPPEAPEGFEYVADSERVLMGIGCVGDNVCDSTEYWIGDRAGESNVGTLPGPVTPVNEIFYQVEGEALNNTDFPADSSLSGRELRVRADEPLTGQVTIHGYQSVGSGVNTTVDVRIDGRNRTTGKFLSLQATSTDHQLPGSPLVLEYSIELDPGMDGDVIVIDNLNLVVRGVNVLNGFVNGTGGSFFDVPTYDLVEIAS